MRSVITKKVFMLYIIMFSSSLFAGVKPVHTREVIGLEREYKVDIVNTSDSPFLVQAWLEDLQGNKKQLPLLVTPPIFEMDAKANGIVRLLPISAQLPNDRESVFWLNIQEIPKKSVQQQSNLLKMAVRSRIKIFVRPSHLNIDEFENASQKLIWSKQLIDGKHYIVAKNDSPYYFSMGILKGYFDNQKYSFPDRFNMIPAFGTQKYLLPAHFSSANLKLKYGVINDYGGIKVINERKVQSKATL